MSLDDSSTLLNTLKPQLSKAAVLFNWILSDSNFFIGPFKLVDDSEDGFTTFVFRVIRKTG
jgi:hypothetical protein